MQQMQQDGSVVDVPASAGEYVDPASRLAAPPVVALSGWKIGFAAGISFALTISLIAGIVWLIRHGAEAMERSQRTAMTAQQEEDAPKVRPEFAKEVRALADVMESEKALLTGDRVVLQKTEADLETRISNLTSSAQSVHESQIANEMYDVHAGVMSCFEDILYGGKPNTPPDTCVDQVKSKDEIEKAVNTPYTKY